ncbi:extradiol ring-cleavage dioxygenase [Pseudonocardia acaciae]|uniref:extradiol ring-cleavage dioxygenase n=1 Tax=Pseudonocardia acaciae TaxID=551276 RepID=UPI00048B8015|nr:extradiol ring-cleavage dioxygenase [Pseudonocardia acaciae]
MSLRYFRPELRSNDLVQDVKWDPELLRRFTEDEAGVLDQYRLPEPERRAIADRDFKRLYHLGLHPYLLSQLARLIYGTAERAGTSAAALALTESLLGTNDDSAEDDPT